MSLKKEPRLYGIYNTKLKAWAGTKTDFVITNKPKETEDVMKFQDSLETHKYMTEVCPQKKFWHLIWADCTIRAFDHITFEQFMSTKKYSPDLGQDLTDADLCETAGFIYCGCLYIEIVSEKAQKECKLNQYYLIIGREEYTNSILRELEKILYNYALEEDFNVS